jgi:hypothetical protein
MIKPGQAGDLRRNPPVRQLIMRMILIIVLLAWQAISHLIEKQAFSRIS